MIGEGWVDVLEMVVDFGGNIMKKMRIFCIKFKLYIGGVFLRLGTFLIEIDCQNIHYFKLTTINLKFQNSQIDKIHQITISPQFPESFNEYLLILTNLVNFFHTYNLGAGYIC